MNVRACHPWICLEQTAATLTLALLLTLPPVDPWFNFRATKYLIKHGFYSFWDWFDDRKTFLGKVMARLGAQIY